MRILRQKMKYVSLVLIGILVISLFSPAGSRAQGAASTSVKTSEQSEAKVDQELRAQFKEEDQVTYLVKLKEQADTKAAADKAVESAKENKASLSAQETKRIQNSAVVSELRATADVTQASLMDYLTAAKEKGNVKEFDSYYIVNAVKVTSTQEVMQDIAALEEVEKVLPNRTRQLLEPMESPAEETAKAELLEAASWGIDRVGAPSVWEETGIDGTGVVVANIDTGVQYDHPALLAKYRGYDAADPENVSNTYNWYDAVAGEAVPYDDQGHGTHTMGTMVGQESDGSNQIGVAPGAKWIAVKAFSALGGTDADLLDAAEYVLAPKDEEGNPHPEMAPDVVNNSWGGGPGLDEWYREMVQNWRNAGIVPVFSAGNDGPGDGTIAAPSNYPESIAVGATDSNDALADFSSRGPSPYDGEIKPDISAPGVAIYSSVPGDGYEGTWNGTSMAAPHVTGTIALLLQADSSLSVDEIETILYETADTATDEDYPEEENEGYGNGIVNAYLAVTSVVSGVGEISGHVYQDGEDTEAPVLTHDPITEVYEGVALPITVSVSDNISVSSVEMQYKVDGGDWESAEAVLSEGNYAEGVYQAVLPSEATSGDSVEYKFIAEDFGGNTDETDVYSITLLPALGVGYEEDFESEPNGWTSFGENNTWEWGTPASGPGEAFSGENVFATALGGTYSNNADATLLFPPVAVPEGETFLQFESWYNLERNFDYGHVVISTDREDWEQAATFNDVSDGWVSTEVNLSDYAGQTIFIGFHLETDGSVVRDGWYLDDVAITDTSSAPAKLHSSAVSAKTVKSEKESVAAKDDASKKKVNPKKLIPGDFEYIQGPVLPGDADESEISPNVLPLNATVTVEETGRSVATNPADGSYQLLQAAGDVTLQASAYGFASSSASVTVPEEGTVTQDFTLTPIAQGEVTGTVTNAQTGDPIAGATVYVVEDAAVEPVTTDESGLYSLTAYEGSYTIKITAPNFSGTELPVTIEGDSTVTADASLDPFIGYPGEIGYDDGTAENARVFYDAGNGWAVKFSLAEGESSAQVTGGLFRFWDETFPSPGGTAFEVAVYDATGPNGAPGNQLAGPIEAEALRSGEWTQVDLASEGIVVDGDFYIVYIQTDPNPNAPALGTDEDGDYAGRSWQYVSGSWSQSPEDEGNYMIRSLVNYEAEAPVITTPEDGSFTNDPQTTVEGTASPDTTVEIALNGETAATSEVSEDGTFSADVTLVAGENELTAVSTTENGSTDPSEPVTITLDEVAPNVTITSPADDEKSNKEVYTVTGTVEDDYLEAVTVNGQEASIEEESFSKRIILDEGDNTIEVTAVDAAGNETTESVVLDVKFTAPDIENLTPEEDVELQAGETVVIEFDSEPGLDAVFYLKAPLTNFRTAAQATELPMRETEGGHYVGYWTATSSLIADGAEIVVKAEDDYGNTAEESAVGKVYVNQ